MEDDKIQDLVNELSQDISRDAQLREKYHKTIRRLIVLAAVLCVLGIFGYFFYLSHSIKKIEQELVEKQNTIDDLEMSLNSLMYSEQIQDENNLTVLEGNTWNESKEGSNLEKKVLNNLRILERASEDHRGENINRGNVKYPEIALTFDLATGSELVTIEKLIQKYNIRVTIFLSNERPSETTGSFFLRSNLQSIMRMQKSEKVEFGNHTWSHYNYVRSIHETSPKKRKVLDYISKSPLGLEQMAEELNRVEQQFSDLTQASLTKYYRLPYGAINSLILNVHASLGYPQHIMWTRNSVGSLDLPDYIFKPFLTKTNENGKPIAIKNPLYKTRKETLEFLYRWEERDPNGMNGAILLMHLGSPRKFEKLIDILPEFIETMKRKGYRFVTISEVLNDRLDP